jgi:hypothetical protein
MTRHPISAGIVNDDQICSAFFDKLRTDSGACASGYDRFSFRKRVVKSVENFLSCVGITYSGPWIGHNVVGIKRFEKLSAQ